MNISLSLLKIKHSLDARFSFSKILVLLTIYTFLFLSPGAGHALPQGAVSSSAAKITLINQNTLIINQLQPRIILNWSSFNINQNQRVVFAQPSTSAIAVNRIQPHGGPSRIAGGLFANGRVVLINANGIYFAPTARVTVSGLIATTANLKNEGSYYAGGKLYFEDTSQYHGSIINDGRIVIKNAGLMAMVGNGVVNNGYIEANMGVVILGASRKYTVDFNGDQLIQFSPDSSVTQARDYNGKRLKDAITNNGTISVNGGKVRLTARTAGQILDRSINMNGIIEAKSVRVKNGQIILDGGSGKVRVTGKVFANGKQKGERGGKVKVLGKQIEIADNALIDVSGDIEGGIILVGGNAYGAGPEPNATQVSIGPNVILNANALTHGNGGKVVVWSDEYTQFHGKIYARGGPQGGNGGWVETSGKELLTMTGGGDASAPNGVGGTWLLDPRNVTITAATAGGAFGGGNPDTFTPVANSATVSAASINGLLDSGTSVIITTGNTGTQAGTITVSSAISKTAGADATLTLEAAAGTGNIIINQPISSNNNKLHLVLVGSGGGSALTTTIGAAITTNGGNFSNTSTTLNVNSAVNTGGGSFTNSSTNFTISNTITTGGGTFTNNSTALNVNNTVNTGAGNFISNTTNNTAMNATGVITSTGAVDINANTDGAGANTFAMNAASQISGNTVSINVNTAVGGTGTATLGVITATNSISVSTDTGNNTTGGDIVMVSTVPTITAPTISLTTPKQTGINIGTSGTPIKTSTNAVTAQSGSSGIFVTNSAVGTLTLNNISTSGTGALRIISDAVGSTGITQAVGTSLNIGGTTTFQVGTDPTQNISLINAGNGFVGMVITSAYDATINAGTSALSFGASSVANNLTITAAGSIAQSAALTVPNVATFTASGNITLSNSGNNFHIVGGSGADVNFRDVNVMQLDNITATGNLSLRAGTSMSQLAGTAILATNGNTTLQASTVAGNLIDLDNAGNDFQYVRVAGGYDVILRDANSLILGAAVATAQTITHNLTVTLPNNGALTQNGTLTVNTITSLDVGTGGSITLANVNNNFNQLNISNANNATIYDTTGIILGDTNVTGNYTLTAEGTLQNIGQIIVNDFDVTAFGNITQSAGEIIANTYQAKTRTAAGSITLTRPNNDFGTIDLLSRNSTDTAVANGDFTIVDVNGLAISKMITSTTQGDMTITAGGAVTENGTGTISGRSLVVTAAGGINLGSPNHTITSLTASNSGSGNITFANDSPATLTLNDITQLSNGNVTITNIGPMTLAGTADVIAQAGHITLSTTGGGNLTINGGVTANSAGDITLAAASATILLDNDITSHGGRIAFNDPVTLTDNITISSGTGFDSGIDFASSFDADGFTLSLQNATSANGNVTFAGDTILYGLSTFAQPYAIIFAGNTTTFNNPITFLNQDGQFLAHTVNGLGVNLVFGDVTLIGATTLTSNSGNVYMRSLSGPYAVSINTGLGTLTIASNIGNTGLVAQSPTTTTLSGDTITLGGNVTVRGHLFITSPLINITGGQYLADRITFGSATSQIADLNGNLTLSANGAITINALINGAHNLTLYTPGQITINGAMGESQRLSNIFITAVNLTVHAPIYTRTYQHLIAGIASFNATLNVSGTAQFFGAITNGSIDVGSLVLSINRGYMVGKIHGLRGVPAIETITVLNEIKPNHIFFDGIDIYPYFVVPIFDRQDIFPNWFQLQAWEEASLENALGLMLADSFFTPTIAGDCVTISPTIIICDILKPGDLARIESQFKHW